MSPKFKSLLTRTISGAIFVALVVGSFFVPVYCQFVLFAFFAVVAMIEYHRVVATDGVKTQLIMGILATLLILESGYFWWWESGLGWLMAFLLILIIPIIELFRKSEKPFNNIAHSVLSICWIAIPFGIAGANKIIMAEEIVLAVFILIWTSDTFAYCGGSLFGKHKMFERISPKKTWEGLAIGGLFTCGAAVGLSYVPYFQNTLTHTAPVMHVLAWIGFGFVVFVTGTLGDLIESMFKRSYGVKDSGNIMPGHGGMLDRFDSFFLAMPFSMIYWVLMKLIDYGYY